MRSYLNSVSKLTKTQHDKLQQALCSYIYSKLRTQVHKLIIELKGTSYVYYNKEWVPITIIPNIQKDIVKSIKVQSDHVPELVEVFTIPRNDKIEDAYRAYINSLYVTDIANNHPSLQVLYESMVPEQSLHNEVVLHDCIQTIVDEANSASTMSEGWYKARNICKNIKCVDTCILIKPDYNNNYVAHVLPLHWYFSLEVPTSVIERVKPELLQAWYEVEAGLRDSALNITQGSTL